MSCFRQGNNLLSVRTANFPEILNQKEAAELAKLCEDAHIWDSHQEVKLVVEKALPKHQSNDDSQIQEPAGADKSLEGRVSWSDLGACSRISLQCAPTRLYLRPKSLDAKNFMESEIAKADSQASRMFCTILDCANSAVSCRVSGGCTNVELFSSHRYL